MATTKSNDIKTEFGVFQWHEKRVQDKNYGRVRVPISFLAKAKNVGLVFHDRVSFMRALSEKLDAENSQEWHISDFDAYWTQEKQDIKDAKSEKKVTLDIKQHTNALDKAYKRGIIDVSNALEKIKVYADAKKLTAKELAQTYKHYGVSVPSDDVSSDVSDDELDTIFG